MGRLTLLFVTMGCLLLGAGCAQAPLPEDESETLDAPPEPPVEMGSKLDIGTMDACIRVADSGPTLGYGATWFSFVNGCKIPVNVFWCDRLRGTNACSASNFGHKVDLVPRETEWSWYDTARFNGVVIAACPQKAPSGEEVYLETTTQTPIDARTPYRCFYYRKSS